MAWVIGFLLQKTTYYKIKTLRSATWKEKQQIALSLFLFSQFICTKILQIDTRMEVSDLKRLVFQQWHIKISFP